MEEIGVPLARKHYIKMHDICCGESPSVCQRLHKMLRNSTKFTKAIFPYLDFLCGVFSLFGLVWYCHGNMAKRSQMIQLNSTEVFFPYVCVLLSSLFIYQYLSDIATRIPLGYNSEYKNKILVSKETEMLRRWECEKFGFIKRVQKGRITTVKDLEGWHSER